MAALRTIHRAHHFAIPFENLDIHLGRQLSFSLDHLVQKLVMRRRGGFCYEQNLLLAAALRSLGFNVSLLEGQMRRKDGGFGPPFDHMTLRVSLPDGDWVADVGNGETFQLPLPWDGSWTPQERGGAYRVIQREENPPTTEARSESAPSWQIEYRRDQSSESEIVYRFSSASRTPSDFRPMCVFHATSLKSLFTKGWIITRPLERGGRITAARGLLMTTQDGRMERHGIGSAKGLEAILSHDFGMLPVGVPPTWFSRGSS